MDIQVRRGVFLRSSAVGGALADGWLLHGFGESGLSFRDAFGSPLAERLNLFAPDLPGFGVSPADPGLRSFGDLVPVVLSLIEDLSGGRPLVLVAHSLGGVLATWLAQRLAGRVRLYVSVEGNLTEADAFFSGQARAFDEAGTFHRSFRRRVFEMLEEDEALHRYYASVRFADPEAMWLLGASGAEASGEGSSGREFAALTCPKVYYWGDRSTPGATASFIEREGLPNRRFPRSGHWPMKECGPEFYDALLEDVERWVAPGGAAGSMPGRPGAGPPGPASPD